MTSWKQYFKISRHFQEMVLPDGHFWAYTFAKKPEIETEEHLISKRYLDISESAKARSIADSWISKGDFIHESDMLTYLFTSVPYLGGILIIKVMLVGDTNLQRQEHLQSIWKNCKIEIDNLNTYEIMYFKAYPDEDSNPLLWNPLKIFKSQETSIYYYNNNSISWSEIPPSSELYSKLKEESTKRKPKYITINNINYYFGKRGDNMVCYFYLNKNPNHSVRFTFGKKYSEPSEIGKKYLWFTNLPSCGPISRHE